MQKELELINFNITRDMVLELIKFDKLKHTLSQLEAFYETNKSNDTKEEIDNIKKELIKTRAEFIKKFRISNKKEIESYLKLKDQI